MGCSQSVPVTLDDNDAGAVHSAPSTSGAGAKTGKLGAGVASTQQQQLQNATNRTASIPKTRDRIDSWAQSSMTGIASADLNNNMNHQSATTASANNANADTNANNNHRAAASASNLPTSATTPTIASTAIPASLGNNNIENNIKSYGNRQSMTSNNVSNKKHLIEAQWRFLWENHSLQIVDPTDVHAVLDSLMSQTINRLSSVEITFIQRRIRSAVKSMQRYRQGGAGSGGGGGGGGVPQSLSNLTGGSGLGGGSNHGSTGGGGVNISGERSESSSSRGVVGKTMRALSFSDAKTTTSASDAQRAAALADKQMVLNETVLAKLLVPPINNNNSTNGGAKNTAIADIVLPNAYAILLHLSPSLWDRVAEIAAFASQKAKLEIDVNKQTLEKWKMPKPSIVPDIEQAPELPNGVTLYALCFVTALSLRGTRRQKLQLLFYLLVDKVGDFLDHHCAGGVPTFLLEVDQETVISLPSLTHYHYYGTAFLPSASPTPKEQKLHPQSRKQPVFCASQSRPPLSISTHRLQQVLQACCCSSSSSFTSTTASTINNIHHDAAPPAPTIIPNMRRNSRSTENFVNPSTATTANVPTPANASGHKRPGTISHNSNGAVFPNTIVMQRLANHSTHVGGCDEAVDAVAHSELEQLVQRIISNNNTSSSASSSSSSDNASSNNSYMMTLHEYAVWADQYLGDRVLDAVLQRLFGGGLPTPKLERDLVQERWLEWQTAWRRYARVAAASLGETTGVATNATASSSEDPSALVLMDRITQTVVALMDPCYNSTMNGDASGSALLSENVMETAQALGVWGGMGGLDGGGAMGHGVLYCVDKTWWDAWAAHVGWTWFGEEPCDPQKQQRTPRPGELSTELLLDRCDALRGTLGSYEMMKDGLRKDRDYVLVPPGVWDVLYELYGGGPPLPRMVKSPDRKFTYSNRVTVDMSDSYNTSNGADLDELVQNLTETGDQRVCKLPESLAVALHPWVIHVHFCDPLQPYRRGEAGPVTIRVMAAPDEPLWRFYVEVITRLSSQAYKAHASDNRGKARLWKKVDRPGTKDPVSRYGPWNLLCKSRHATLPLMTDSKDVSEHYDELVQNWKEYTDNATVESVGISDRDHIMLEFAVLNKNGDLVWPREAAAKAGRVRRLAEEDIKFRRTLLGLDDKGSMLLKPPSLVGMEVDAMDSTGRWYPVTILEADVVDDDTDDEMEHEEEASGSKGRRASRKKVRVDFKEHSGHQEWIDVESDRIAVAGRFTSETERRSSGVEGKTNGSSATVANEPKPKPIAPVKQKSGDLGGENGKICLWPGYGACGLTNLGNTCYVNSAIQCISYLPLLRSYLISAQYKSTGDLNKENPLGTGGKLLEEFAELLRALWGARVGEKSPTRFRSQLGKVNSQFSGADQQDAQEFLNYILDVLHEDSNKVRRKPYVEALEDDWVKKNSLPRVGDESWRRFLRRNRSIMSDVAMGQVLNTVACPVCNFSSRNFDPFNLLSIPIPTVTDVIFKCIVFRRTSALNCSWVLNKPRKGEKHATRYVRKVSSSPTGPPSETNAAEQYVIAMSRLADSGDLRLQIQNASGIPSSQLRLCRAEEIVVKREDGGDKSVVARHMKVVPLADKDGPCSQLAKKRSPGSDEELTPVTLIVAFEATMRPRLVSTQASKEEAEHLEDTADEDEEGEVDDDQILLTPKEQEHVKRYVEVYGDEQECRLVDTNPLFIAKAVSRSLWPRTDDELKLGLRVDARDHRGNWFPGNVVEIIDDQVNGGDADTGEELSIRTKKVRVHFDNFSSKWDEVYSIEHFENGSVRPLYAHSSPRSKPTEFVVHNRHTDRNSGLSIVFGQSFYVQCHNEWSNARAGAHVLAQASRYLRQDSVWGSGEFDDPAATDREGKARRLYEKTQSTISDLIDLLVDCDREYVRLALGVSEHSTDQEKVQPYRNPAFDPTALSSLLVKKVAVLLQRLPFELRVCTVDTGSAGEEITFPFSLIRTIGNYMNARHAMILQWREPPVDKKSGSSRNYLDSPVMYVEPKVEIDRTSAEILKNKTSALRDSCRKNTVRGGSAGIDLGVCLTEFCKVQNLTIADNWKCPHCKKFREGQQSMNIWRLPDLLTFHIKRFNMSARWREKITTKVNFPLTGLDMSEWCHIESPTIKLESGDAYVYDLIGVVNHYGSMTGGHYVATCKATRCGRDGKEEVAYNFNGVGANAIEAGDPDEPTGWRLGRPKVEVNQIKVTAAMAAQLASESAEPLWLQFDDELVEPIPPRLVVSENAYVLFYRRRRMTPSNIAKYSTLD